MIGSLRDIIVRVLAHNLGGVFEIPDSVITLAAVFTGLPFFVTQVIKSSIG